MLWTVERFSLLQHGAPWRDMFAFAAKPTWHPEPLHLWDSLQSFAPTVQTVCLTAVTVLKPAESYCNMHFWPSLIWSPLSSCDHSWTQHSSSFCGWRMAVYAGDMEVLYNKLQRSECEKVLLQRSTLICCSFKSCQDNRCADVNIKLSHLNWLSGDAARVFHFVPLLTLKMILNRSVLQHRLWWHDTIMYGRWYGIRMAGKGSTGCAKKCRLHSVTSLDEPQQRWEWRCMCEL